MNSPPPRNFQWSSVAGAWGMDIFWNYTMGKEINHCRIPVYFAVCNFTKFWIPPPLFFKPKTMMWIFPSPEEENPIHLLIFPRIFPWLAWGRTPRESRWHVHYGRWLLFQIKPQGVFCKVRFLTHLLLGPLHVSPVNLAGPATGTNFTLGWYEKFRLSFCGEIRLKILWMSSGVKFEKQSKCGETQSYNFHAYHSFGNIYSCITAVIKMGCLWCRKYSKQSKTRPSRHALPCFHPGNWAEVFIQQNFPARFLRSWLENLRSQEPSQPILSYEHIKRVWR